VWNLYAKGVQILRAADCKKLAESPAGDFRQTKAGLKSPALFSVSKNVISYGDIVGALIERP